MNHDIQKRTANLNNDDSASAMAENTSIVLGTAHSLDKTLSARHTSMIGLGASIGLGLWLGSGKSLVTGGPAAIFLGYIIAGSVVCCVTQCLGEMAVLYPLPSAFVQWTSKFVDPSAGFALGWCYWLHAVITIANELQGTVTVLSYWNESVPKAVWICVFWLVIVCTNIGAVKVFAEVEVVAAAIKFGWIFVIIISFIVISAGGAPNHEPIGFRYWNETAFTHGFKGFLAVMPTCVFAMASSENIGLLAAETRNPLRSMPPAINAVWMRLTLFYVLGALMVTITVSPNSPDLFGGSNAGSGTNASPFVIAYKMAQLAPLAHIMNAIIFVSVLSAGSIAAYAGSRTLVGLSQLRMAPKLLGTADSWGRPWYALAPTLLLGGGLACLNLSESGIQVFTWLSNLASLFTLYSWSMICLSNIRMRRAWKVQGRPMSDLPWRSWGWPFAAYWGLACCIVLFIAQFYLAVWPLGEDSSAENFFATFVSAIAGMVIYAAAKCYYGGRRWVDLAKVDLDAGRQFYTEEDMRAAMSKKRALRSLFK